MTRWPFDVVNWNCTNFKSQQWMWSELQSRRPSLFVTLPSWGLKNRLYVPDWNWNSRFDIEGDTLIDNETTKQVFNFHLLLQNIILCYFNNFFNSVTIFHDRRVWLVHPSECLMNILLRFEALHQLNHL